MKKYIVFYLKICAVLMVIFFVIYWLYEFTDIDSPILNRYFAKPPVIIEKTYFYHNTKSCVQRSILIEDFETFRDYSNKYIENNTSPDSGVYLGGLETISLSAYNPVFIHSIDTLQNGFKYAYATQKTGKRNREFRGYVMYDFKKINPCDSNSTFCQQYLDFIWSNRYGRSPDKY